VKVVKLLSRSARLSEAAALPFVEARAPVLELDTAPAEKVEQSAPHESLRQADRSRSPPSREVMAERRAKCLAVKLTRRFEIPSSATAPQLQSPCVFSSAAAPQPRSPCVFDTAGNVSEEESAEASSIGRSCSGFTDRRSQQKAKSTSSEVAPGTPGSEEGETAASSGSGITRIVTLKARKDRQPKPHTGKAVGTWRQVFSRPSKVEVAAPAVSLQPDQEPKQDGHGILDKFMAGVMHGAPPGNWCPIEKSVSGQQACKSDGEKETEPGRHRRLSFYGGA